MDIKDQSCQEIFKFTSRRAGKKPRGQHSSGGKSPKLRRSFGGWMLWDISNSRSRDFSKGKGARQPGFIANESESGGTASELGPETASLRVLRGGPSSSPGRVAQTEERKPIIGISDHKCTPILRFCL